jgi:hypothetical protein
LKKQCNRPIEEKEGWSARVADGQRVPISSINGPVGPTDRPMANQKVGRFKEIRQKEKHGEGGSIHDWQRVKSQF